MLPTTRMMTMVDWRWHSTSLALAHFLVEHNIARIWYEHRHRIVWYMSTMVILSIGRRYMLVCYMVQMQHKLG